MIRKIPRTFMFLGVVGRLKMSVGSGFKPVWNILFLGQLDVITLLLKFIDKLKTGLYSITFTQPYNKE
jgi:hypothetical protein